MDLVSVDLVLRAATVALSAAAALAIVLRPRANRVATLAALVVAGIGVFMIASAPGAYAALGLGAFFFNAWCLATPAIVWMLAMALFREDARLAWWHLALTGAVVAVTMAGDYGRFRLGPLADFPELARALLLGGRGAAVLLLFAACAMAAMHWREDLVEERRRARAGFIAVFGAAFVMLAGSEFVFKGQGAPLGILVVGHGILLAVSFALLQLI
ncbi:MAG TPA: hypothetical protein VF348_08100, partial [Usitatibacter sp.]